MFGIGYSELFILLFLVLTPFVHLLLAVWVGRDAARRGDNAAVWAVGTLVGGLLGFALYLVMRRPTLEEPG